MTFSPTNVFLIPSWHFLLSGCELTEIYEPFEVMFF